MRRCSDCKTHKPLEDFHNDKNKPLGKSYRCKPCGSSHRDRNSRKAKYGLTDEVFKSLYKEQDSACAICKRTDTGIARTKMLSVDHSHETGKVRGLLCNWCNQGLGHFKDSPELLIKAAEYLRSSV